MFCIELIDTWSMRFPANRFNCFRQMELPGGLVFLASTFISVVRQVALRLPGASRVEWLVASVDIKCRR